MRKLLEWALKILISYYKDDRIQMPRTPKGDVLPSYDSPRFKRLVEAGRCIKAIKKRLDSGGGERRRSNAQEVFEFFDQRT